MGICVEGEGHQCELVKRMSDESTLPWGDASPKSMDGHDGLSDDKSDVGAHGEEQPETQSGADIPSPASKKCGTLADMYKTFVGPPSGGKLPARKRPRGDLEVDTPTAKANNANEESSVEEVQGSRQECKSV